MNRLFSFFTADYRDGYAYIAGKRYTAGSFAVQLLNQFYVNDTGARIIVFRQSNREVQEELSLGYIYERKFQDAGMECQYILQTLDKIRPFNLFDIEAEKQRVSELFSGETCDQIDRFFHLRSQIEARIPFENFMHVYAPGYTPEGYRAGMKKVEEVLETLKFYETIGDGIGDAFDELRSFVKRLDEAEHLNEQGLLPLAREELRGQIETVTQYVPTLYKKKPITVRRLRFADYYSFILTDFYEGLHHGHYPRRCPVCKKYFLMKNARRQYYCSGKAPAKLTGGKNISCRKYAASCGQKELAMAVPVLAEYKKRMGYIRTNKRRGNYDEATVEVAKKYALELKETAILDEEYGRSGYFQDMLPKNFNAHVRKLMKGMAS